MSNEDEQWIEALRGRDDEDEEPLIVSAEMLADREEFGIRAQAAGIKIEYSDEARASGTASNQVPPFTIDMKSARGVRRVYVRSDAALKQLLTVGFEKFIFLSGYEAICSYQDGLIEASVRSTTNNITPTSYLFRRIFGYEVRDLSFDSEAAKIVVNPPDLQQPTMELSVASDAFRALIPIPSASRRLTVKLTGCHISQHDEALALLQRTANALFFQIDMISEVAIVLERDRKRSGLARRRPRTEQLITELQYPKTQFDDAPLSLYWYGRSAAGMPLLQFLAFYQVIEFYFPTYSKAEAQRKLKAILKDPTFRGDRDTDIGRLLSAIHISRSGAYGDERSQLRATLAECVDPTALRAFLESDKERNEFYTAKTKEPKYSKLSLANPTADLRNEAADRIYDIRCKIVHTKNEGGDREVDLLLPYSPEAQDLSIDIELVQHVAQAVLIMGSTPMR